MAVKFGLCYAEGDLYFTQCVDDDGYDRELAGLCAFHKPSPAYVVLAEGQRTDYYQDRAELFIDPDRFVDRLEIL